MTMELNVSESPADGISSLEFSPSDPNQLAVGSWDRTVRLYDVATDKMLMKVSNPGVVLDVCYGSDGHSIFYGGLSKQVRCIDTMNGSERVLGKHVDAVRSLAFNRENHLLFSGSWDKSVKLWDTRATQSCIQTLPQQNKVFAMDTAANMLVVATAGRIFNIYDIRQLNAPLQQRESSLKYMTRTVKCMPDGQGYVSTSIEGRVAVEFFSSSPVVQANKYAFKCHRRNENGVDTVYPVNAIAFHPRQGTFASGGGDGVVNVWDGKNKKRIKQFPQYPTSIAALSFNNQGDKLAIAVSYTFEEGDKSHAPDAIVIKSITDSDVRPKQMP